MKLRFWVTKIRAQLLRLWSIWKPHVLKAYRYVWHRIQHARRKDPWDRGCDGCQHLHSAINEYPCAICRRPGVEYAWGPKRNTLIEFLYKICHWLS